jgi:hypothetical protein
MYFFLPCHNSTTHKGDCHCSPNASLFFCLLLIHRDVERNINEEGKKDTLSLYMQLGSVGSRKDEKRDEGLLVRRMDEREKNELRSYLFASGMEE